MKKRKIREELHGMPLEWPKTMSFDILRTIDKLACRCSCQCSV